jgi:hypothetical protein
MDDTKKARTIILEQIAYNKSRGWRTDNLERVARELWLMVEQRDQAEELLFKCFLYFLKSERHASHLYWVSKLDQEQLYQELDAEAELHLLKHRYNEWKQSMG